MRSYYLFFVVFIAAMGGLLFGYHTAIISGALIFLTPAFELTVADQGMVVSIILIGAMLGAFCGGDLADRIGRKGAMALTAVLFIVGAGILTFAESYWVVLLGRFISGIGVGTTSVISPLYLSEISPPHLRGRFVSIFQLMITIGILAAFTVNYFFASQQLWPWMFAFGIVPALVQLLAVYFIKETPQWLFKKGKESLAKSALKSLYGTKSYTQALKKAPAHAEMGKWKSIFASKYFFILIIGLILSMCQQITGINTVIYYAPIIFKAAGFTTATGAILATVGIGIINVIATIISVCLLDRAGRRIFLLIGVMGMTLSLGVLSLAFFTNAEGIDTIAMISLMAYVAFFAIGLGPVTFVILSEIYPLKIRAKAITLAIFANWFFNYLVSLTFLDLIAAVGPGTTFLIFAAISLGSFFFIFRYIPETKGKSLEEIEKELT